MKKSLLLSLVVASLLMTGCDKDDDNNDEAAIEISDSKDTTLEESLNNDIQHKNIITDNLSNFKTTGTYDLNDYLEQSSTVHEYDEISSVDGSSINTVDINVDGNKHIYTEVNEVTEVVVLNDRLTQDVIFDEDSEKFTVNRARHVNVGDTLLNYHVVSKPSIDDEAIFNLTITADIKCTLDSAINSFSLESHDYSGDILKFICVADSKIETGEINKEKVNELFEGQKDFFENDAEFEAFKTEQIKNFPQNETFASSDYSELYLKKGVGVIADVDFNCEVDQEGEGFGRVNDTEGCNPTNYQHSLLREVQ